MTRLPALRPSGAAQRKLRRKPEDRRTKPKKTNYTILEPRRKPKYRFLQRADRGSLKSCGVYVSGGRRGRLGRQTSTRSWLTQGRKWKKVNLRTNIIDDIHVILHSLRGKSHVVRSVLLQYFAIDTFNAIHRHLLQAFDTFI